MSTWAIHLIYPSINTALTHRRGATLLAQGLVRIDEIYVDTAETEKEARKKCMALCINTLKDRGLNSTIIGYGIRNRYAKKRSHLSWKVSLQQMVEGLRRRRKRTQELRA